MNGLKDLYDYWASLCKHKQARMLRLDPHTVQCLQLLAPGISERDKTTAKGLVLGGEAFSNFSMKERTSIWKRMKAKKCIIPSLDSFFQDTWYLESCANCIKRLIPPTKFQPTLRRAMQHAFSLPYSGVSEFLIQVSETEFRSYLLPEIDPAEVAYRQIWLYAMRHYPKMPKEPQKKDQVVKDWQMADQKTLFEFASLAHKLGYKSEKINALLKESPDKQIAREALLKARKPHLFTFNNDDFESLVERVVQCFELASPQSSESKAVTAHQREAPLKTRRGKPQPQDQEGDRRLLFLNHFHCTPSSIPQKVTSLFVRQSVYFKFFPGQKIAFEVEGPARSASPLFVPLHEKMPSASPATRVKKNHRERRNRHGRRKREAQTMTHLEKQKKRNARKKEASRNNLQELTTISPNTIHNRAGEKDQSSNMDECDSSSSDIASEMTLESSEESEIPHDNGATTDSLSGNAHIERNSNPIYAEKEEVETDSTMKSNLSDIDSQCTQMMENASELEVEAEQLRDPSPQDVAMEEQPSGIDPWDAIGVEQGPRKNSIVKRNTYRERRLSHTESEKDSQRSRSPFEAHVQASGRGEDGPYVQNRRKPRQHSFLEENQKSLEREIHELTTPNNRLLRQDLTTRQTDSYLESQTKELPNEAGKKAPEAPLTTSAKIFTPPSESLEGAEDGDAEKRANSEGIRQTMANDVSARVDNLQHELLQSNTEEDQLASQGVRISPKKDSEHKSRRDGVIFKQSASGQAFMPPGLKNSENSLKSTHNKLSRSIYEQGQKNTSEETVESQGIEKPGVVIGIDGQKTNELMHSEIQHSTGQKRPLGFLGYSKEYTYPREGKVRVKAKLKKSRQTRVDFQDFTDNNGSSPMGSEQPRDVKIPSKVLQTFPSSASQPAKEVSNEKGSEKSAPTKGVCDESFISGPQHASAHGDLRIPIIFRGRNDRGEWKEIIHQEMIDPSNPKSVETFAKKKAREQEATFYDRNLRQIAPAKCFEAAVADGMNTIFVSFGRNLAVNQETMESVSHALLGKNHEEEQSSDDSIL